jgi:hypothetical protein
VVVVMLVVLVDDEVVEDVVLDVDVVVVVVVVVTQPVAPQASQQLEKTPTQPPRAVQWAASLFVRQRVTPLRVTQQATLPGLPQVDFEAHFTINRWHSRRRVWLMTAWAATPPAQRT